MSKNTNSPLLEVRQLQLCYGPLCIMQNCDFDINAGEFISLFGPSGCGKSSIIRCIAGLMRSTQGTLDFEGKTLEAKGHSHVPTEKRGITFVPQDYALFAHLSCEKNIAFGISKKPNCQQRVEELLELFKLTELRQRKPAQLSGGQQQRVALARALAPQPALILLDEPFANIDITQRRRFGLELKKQIKQSNCAALLVTHDREEALMLSDRIVVIDSPAAQEPSQVLQFDTPNVIYNKPSSLKVAQHLGTCMQLQAQCAGNTADSLLGTVQVINAHTGSATLLLRPEQCRFSPAVDGPAQITQIHFHGALSTLTCRIQEQIFYCEMPSRDINFQESDHGQITVTTPLWKINN